MMMISYRLSSQYIFLVNFSSSMDYCVPAKPGSTCHHHINERGLCHNYFLIQQRWRSYKMGLSTSPHPLRGCLKSPLIYISRRFR